ncbi:endoribonuclease L-PSP [Klebsiella oxytoca]|nr:endoribonuclease L-PSP [Klebsiella oxytoca]
MIISTASAPAAIGPYVQGVNLGYHDDDLRAAPG